MTQPTFGFQFNQVNTDPKPLVFGDFSVLGLIIPDSVAQAGTFPLGVEVDINTGDAAVLTAAGSGPIGQVLAGINACLDDLQRSARAVIVRVLPGADATEAIANILAAIPALKRAPQSLGVTPRLIGFPGYTGIVTYGLANPVITTPGTGYTAATIAFNPTGATANVTVTSGAVSAITLTNPGNYSVGTNVTATISGDGTGAAATFTLEELENPLCAALPGLLSSLLGHSFVGGPGATKTDAINWRTTIADQRQIPVDNWHIISDGNGGTLYQDGAVQALGLQVRTDHQHGGFPFWSAANRSIPGILGVKRIDSFSLVDGATDAQELLAAGIGVTVRGDASDVALTDSGYSFVAFQNASTDTLWNLYNKTRGRDFINLALIKAMRQHLGVDNISPHSVQAVINEMNELFTYLSTLDGALVGYKCGFDGSVNTPDAIRAGKLRVFYGGEQSAPILQITVDAGLDRQALVDEIAVLSTQVATG